MKFNQLLSAISLLTASVSAASRADFFGPKDVRPELFKILDDHIGTIKVTISDEDWATMKNYTIMEPWGEVEKYSTEKGKMEFAIAGTNYKVELKEGDFKFGIGGAGSRNFARSGYNIKVKNNDVYGVKNLRLRANSRDISFMREKICSDILNKMDIPSTTTNFVNLEVNGEKMGLYVLTNKIKNEFINSFFGEKDTDNLYECSPAFCRFEDESIVKNCVNSKEELADKKDDLQKLVDAVNNAKTIDDIKDIIDTDFILRSFAFEFLVVSWDNFLDFGHNYFWYKRPTDGKWIMLLNDFDETFGQDFWSNFISGEGVYVDKSYIPNIDQINLANLSIRDMDIGHKIVKLLIYDDNETRWRQVLSEYIKKVYNPKVLIPRINDIADLIREDLMITRKPDPETGYSMGAFNTLGYNPVFNSTQFEDSINYIGWNDNPGQARSYPLRFLIEERFKYVCHTYGFNPETLEVIEPRPVVSFWSIKNKQKLACSGNIFEDPITSFNFENLVNEDYKSEAYNADPEKNSKPRDYTYPLSVHEKEQAKEEGSITTSTTETTEAAQTQEGSTTTSTTETTEAAQTQEGSTTTSTTETTEAAQTQEGSCWSEKYGYPCCESSCHAYTTTDEGEWGYENNHWCGIPASCASNPCWSIKYGYECCKGCYAYEVEGDLKWGYEDNHWCGIINENCN